MGTHWFYCPHCRKQVKGEHFSTTTYHRTGETRNEYKCGECGLHSTTTSGGKKKAPA